MRPKRGDKVLFCAREPAGREFDVFPGLIVREDDDGTCRAGVFTTWAYLPVVLEPRLLKYGELELKEAGDWCLEGP